MASKMQQVCEALVSQLETAEAAGTFSIAIVTERWYDTELPLEDTSIVSVIVVPARSNRTRKSQNTWNRDIVVDIIVRKRFAQSEMTDGKVDIDAIDPYIELLEQIDDYLADPTYHVLTDYTDAIYIPDDEGESDREIMREMGIRFPWVPKHLNDWQQYTGIVRVGYHVESEFA